MRDGFLISPLTLLSPLLRARVSALTDQQPDCSQWNSVAHWKRTITVQGNSAKLIVPGVPNLAGTFQKSDSIQLTLTSAEISGPASPYGAGTQAGPIYFLTGGQDLQISFNRTEMNGDCAFQVTDGHPVYPTSVYGFINVSKGSYSLSLRGCSTPLTIQPVVTEPLHCQADAPPSCALRCAFRYRCSLSGPQDIVAQQRCADDSQKWLQLHGFLEYQLGVFLSTDAVASLGKSLDGRQDTGQPSNNKDWMNVRTYGNDRDLTVCTGNGIFRSV